MNKYVKEFFHRGLMFSGFGPMIFGIICFTIYKTSNEIITPFYILLGIITTYIIAFIHAGISVITTYDKLNRLQQATIQGIVLYSTYLTGYMINSWLPLKALPIIIFSTAFILGFIFIWLTVYFVTKKMTNDLNKKLETLNIE